MDRTASRISIEIPVSLCEYIESLDHEVRARKDMLAYMIDRGMNKSDFYREYHDEYVEYNTKFTLAKNELAAKHIMPTYPNCNWSLDYMTHTVTVEVSE